MSTSPSSEASEEPTESSDATTSVTTPDGRAISLANTKRLPGWFAPLFFFLLATLFLWRSTFTGEVFLPARMLGHVAPYSATVKEAELPPWNPLRWDGIAQFYPWRNFAAQTLRTGTLPLWNPYQFCGTPFVANSQSAVFYPGNLLFVLFPTATAFNLSALLHLTLCGWFLYLFLRRLGVTELSALLGGIVATYSAWQVNWLQLPTFLATSCWFPLLLRELYRLRREEKAGRRMPTICSIGLTMGMMLLAGHLQIAFYGIFVGTLWGTALLILRFREVGTFSTMRGLAQGAGGLLLGLMLASTQILPSVELSRISHRVGKPSAEGFQAYREYALPLAGLILLTLPDFYGNDSSSENPYWGFYTKEIEGNLYAIRHNAAETANYVGLLPLLLGTLAIMRAFQKDKRERRVLFFAGLALLTLLLALGTPLNALFYFGVPGFGQSGSPARILVLWSLAWSVLVAFGLDALLQQRPDKRQFAVVSGTLLFLLAIGLSIASQAIKAPVPSSSIPALGEVFGRIGLGWLRIGVVGTGSILLFSPFLSNFLARRRTKFPLLVGCAVLLVLFDLFSVGLPVNPSSPPELVYPTTSGITLLKEKTGHERIFPVNQRWSLYKSPPAILPPNGAMVYGLRDVQGYDSLLTGQYKAFANGFVQGTNDASPPEVGNMVFFQNANAPLAPFTAAAFAVTLSTTSQFLRPDSVPPTNSIYNVDREMAIYPMKNPRPRAELLPQDASMKSSLPAPAWVEDTPTRITLQSDAPVPSLLHLADQFYPGWKAQIDGQAVPIQRRSEAPIFRTVSVPSGQHTITFRYEPASFRLGLYLACLAGMILSLGTLSTITSRARKTS